MRSFQHHANLLTSQTKLHQCSLQVAILPNNQSRYRWSAISTIEACFPISRKPRIGLSVRETAIVVGIRKEEDAWSLFKFQLVLSTILRFTASLIFDYWIHMFSDSYFYWNKEEAKNESNPDILNCCSWRRTVKFIEFRKEAHILQETLNSRIRGLMIIGKMNFINLDKQD